MLEIVCMKWGEQYGADHVNRLHEMLRRNVSQPFRLTCFTDRYFESGARLLPLPVTPKTEGMHGKKLRYTKLWFYSKNCADLFGGRKALFLDLDVVITGSLDPLLDSDDDIKLWDDPHQKTPYNSSIVLHKTGTRTAIWDRFDPETSPTVCERNKVIGHDQNWVSVVIGPNEPTWKKSDGIYSFRNDIMRPNLKELPDDARIVVFHGPRDASQESIQVRYPWVKEHWQ